MFLKVKNEFIYIYNEGYNFKVGGLVIIIKKKYLASKITIIENRLTLDIVAVRKFLGLNRSENLSRLL
jgi:hypothetical protein